MILKELKYIYMIGIGGIGMSAIAKHFHLKGKKVAGYDKISTEITQEMESEGMEIHYSDDVNEIPAQYKRKETIVVYTPAIPEDHSEFIYFKNNGNKIFKRAEILGMIAADYKEVAVAGTHGKTTISTMIAHAFKQSEIACNAFLGGISKNYSQNYLNSDQSEYVVVEADEYDRSFLQLNPDLALISSIDADHLDVYGERDEVNKAFEDFIRKIKPGGQLIINKKLETDKLKEIVNYLTYSFEDSSADYYMSGLQIDASRYRFNVHTPGRTAKEVILGIPGLYNVENAIGAFACMDYLGMTFDQIRFALRSFSGIKRRFDFIIDSKVIFIDDYAHHPVEIKACIDSVRDLYKGRKITGIFQPHLFTRTRDLNDDFADSLSLLDELILLDIYPARELPIEGITSKIIYDKVRIDHKVMCSKEQLIEKIKEYDIDVLLTMGAGDIDQIIPEIERVVLEKYNILNVQ